MNELIKVNYDSDKPVVSGRELHGFLDVKTAYKDWFPRMVEYGFVDGTDFCSILSESTGGRPSIDHAITLDMAKELAMLQRNEKGKQARQYFIAIEKAWNDPDKVIERAQKILAARVAKLEIENSRLALELDQSKDYYTIKRVAKDNGVSWKIFSWRRLKNTSEYMQLEIKKVFDANYVKVNAYHTDVWEHEYPEFILQRW